MKKNLPAYLYIISYTIFSILIILGFKLGVDVFWHIKVGEWIYHEQTIPKTAIFTYTTAGIPWISHEWLSELIIYFVYKIAEWKGLLLLTLTCTIATLLIINIAISKYTTPIRCIILITLSFLLISPHILPRPHIIAFPFLALWALNLLNAVDKKTTPSLLNLLLLIFWVNIHASFIFGLLLILYFTADAVFKEKELIHKKKQLSKWGLFFVLSLACCLLNPHGIDVLLYPFQHSSILHPLQNSPTVFSTNFITEWKSPDFHNFSAFELWLLLLLAFSWLRGLKIPPLQIIFLLALIHISLKHIRFISDLLAILAPITLAPFIQSALEKSNRTEKNIQPINFFKLNILIMMLVSSVLIGITIFRSSNILPKHTEKTLNILKIIRSYTPETAHIFNSYDLGGPLIFTSFQPFIDGRGDFYGEEYLIHHQQAVQLTKVDGFQNLNLKHNFSLIFLLPPSPLITFLHFSNEWECLYNSDTLVVYNHIDHNNLPIKKITKALNNLFLMKPCFHS